MSLKWGGSENRVSFDGWLQISNASFGAIVLWGIVHVGFISLIIVDKETINMAML